jgi:hypothetical protein
MPLSCLISASASQFRSTQKDSQRSSGSGKMGSAARSLQHLQELCANLKTLETYVHRGNSQYLVEVSPTDTLLVPEMLLEVDRQLKAIPSLSNIIIRFYNGRPTSLVKETMQGLGWTVFMTNEDHY